MTMRVFNLTNGEIVRVGTALDPRRIELELEISRGMVAGQLGALLTASEAMAIGEALALRGRRALALELQAKKGPPPAGG